MNPWVTFNELISSEKRTIAEVLGSEASGKIRVMQLGETVATYVESNGGSSAPGSYVFIEGGIIVGQAPEIRAIATELLS